MFCFVAGDERHAAHRIAELKCLRAWAVQVQLSGVPSARSNSRGGLSSHVLSILRSRIQGAGVSPRLREAVNNRPLTAGLVLQRLVAKHVGGDKAGAQATEPSANRLRTADLNLGALCDPDCDKLVRAAAQICYYSYRSGTTDGALAGVFISNDECFTYVCETMKLVRYDLGMSGVGTGMVRIDGPFPITPAGVSTEVLVWPVHRCKGLTMPLLSYGGSSMIIMTMAVFILMRIDHEIRLQSIQATSKKKLKKSKVKQNVTASKTSNKPETEQHKEGEQYDWI